MVETGPSRGAIYATWFHVLVFLTILGYIAHDLFQSSRTAGALTPAAVLVSPAMAAILVAEVCRRTGRSAALTWGLSLATLILGLGGFFVLALQALSG